ncbi:MAG: MgtC/SapB family protein [Pseudomonadales bacterium]|nr:MgtC/SapB family protein [Pseudomonadales bacterium]MBP7908420.1 MgtC/SapB family protein [Pseudomonadales bacterium]
MIEIDIGVAQRFLVALLIGALVGVEREKSQSASGHRTIAGLRTFILLALLGSVSAWIALHVGGSLVFAITLGAVALAVLTGYVLESRAQPGRLGLSSEFAAIAVFLLGGVVMYGYPELAVALGIVTSAVLAFKQPLHGMVARVGLDDIYAVLKLLIASFIVLPLLPNHPVDPWGALNPYTLWLLVILISGLSLVGYVAVRLLGAAHGTVLTGFAGGLVSSTAVSLSFARQSRTDPGTVAADALAAGILTAWAVMFVRVMITVAIVNRELLPTLVRGFGVMALAAAVMALAFYARGLRRASVTARGDSLPVKNPFSLGSAVQFALLFAVVLVIVELTHKYAPVEGLYLVAAVAGLTDVDAITLSMAQGSRDGIGFAVATHAIGIAAVSNTLVKCTMVLALGRGPLRPRLAVATAVLVACGALAALVVN